MLDLHQLASMSFARRACGFFEARETLKVRLLGDKSMFKEIQNKINFPSEGIV